MQKDLLRVCLKEQTKADLMAEKMAVMRVGLMVIKWVDSMAVMKVDLRAG